MVLKKTEKPIIKKLSLHGFNNLTKTLSFNLYDICYTKTVEEREEYIRYIDEQYNAERLTEILKKVTDQIGATVLNIAVQDYEPQGASVTMLICEESDPPKSGVHHLDVPTPAHTASNASVVGHLDKSHVTVHTYPEYHPDNGVCTFRADIDISTCGQISPLVALNYLIENLEADIITLDYKVRGFTRDITGKKLFIDHKINSIQTFISKKNRNDYDMIDVNVYQENIFHTKCKWKNFDLDDYLFQISADDLTAKEIKSISAKLKNEMDEIFYGKNIPM